VSNVESTAVQISNHPMPQSPPPIGDNVVKNARAQIRSIVERIERLEEEKKGTSDDIRDIYAESKGNGFDVKALRTIVRMRKMDDKDRQEQETVLDTYLQAMGMI
jgi:uncharacterized protein (UPF0335 family)